MILVMKMFQWSALSVAGIPVAKPTDGAIGFALFYETEDQARKSHGDCDVVQFSKKQESGVK